MDVAGVRKYAESDRDQCSPPFILTMGDDILRDVVLVDANPIASLVGSCNLSPETAP